MTKSISVQSFDKISDPNFSQIQVSDLSFLLIEQKYEIHQY